MSEFSPLVSVVIPTYNRASLLERALSSVRSQTYNDIEIIVVDDASEENIEKVARKYNVDKYIKHHQNKGAASARNSGIEASSGSYIAFLDSDDEWLPDKLEKQVGAIDDLNVDVVYSAHYSCIDSYVIPHKPKQPSNHRKALLRGWMGAITSTLLISADALNNIRFDERLPSFQEHDLLVQLSNYGEFHAISKPLVITYHDSTTGISQNPESREDGAKVFFDKWKSHIIEAHGKSTYQKFRSDRYSDIHALYCKRHLESNSWWFALVSLLKSLRTKAASHTQAECILAWLFGFECMMRFKKLYFKSFGENKTELLL